MASVVKRNNRWYLRFKDATGRCRKKVSTAKTKPKPNAWPMI